ncbi:MAG: hypothetical protein FWB78_09340 [Treponema sp.]|nr:hypothetical protein [Treponema sp.]
MSKKQRFFCDNCATEVGYNVKTCPHCGRYFASVRCPACGFVGEDETFSKGCPACGYSTSKGKAAGPPKKVDNPRPVPFWVLFVFVGVFVFAFALLFLLL